MSINKVKFEVKLLSPQAKIPTKAHIHDAAFDIYIPHGYHLCAGARSEIHTGLAIRPPVGWYFTIEGRSSLFKRGVVPLRGIIDAEYTGELVIVLVNDSLSDVTLWEGDRIAQIVPHKVDEMELEQVEEFSHREGERGDAGWGSSGT